MFIIAKDKKRSHSVMAKLRAELAEFNPGPIQFVPIDEFWLSWFRCKPSDNLHIFENGIIVGKLDFGETSDNFPIQHSEAIPQQLHSLLISVRVVINESDIQVIPNGITNVYVSGGTVSDMQLLLADLQQLMPDPLRVATFSAVGYLTGNLTLFSEVNRIPFLHSYDLKHGKSFQVEEYQYRKNDDDALISRVIEIMPHISPSYLGMTGGYDSRFVLGCMLKSGVKPNLVHRKSEDTQLVTLIARDLNLDLQIIDGTAPLPPHLYTLATDAQIYFRGSGYSRVREALTHNGLYFTGFFAECVIKIFWSTAWKIPSITSSIHNRLVTYGQLANAPGRLRSLKQHNEKPSLQQFLEKELSFEQRYYDFHSGKEWSGWFYYMNRGLRWTQAAMADLSFYAYPVFVLSDLLVLSLGISSRAWDNFHKDRVRNLNRQFFPDLNVGYDDSDEVLAPNGIRQSIIKMKYEYADRLLFRYRSKRGFASKTKSFSMLDDVPTHLPNGFDNYYHKDLSQILLDNVSYTEKRAAITMFHVLKYLENR